MANDSSTGGYLQPAPSPAPMQGVTLEDFLYGVLTGVTGVAENFFRPRWQKEPPNMPNIPDDWAAFGIGLRRAEPFAYVAHDPSGNGRDKVVRHEELDLMVSFYGPNADDNASKLREGLSVAQNREAMQAVGMGVVEVGDVVPAPSLVNERWQYRLDVTVVLRRVIRRDYPVLNVLNFQGSVSVTDTHPAFAFQLES